MLMFSKGELHTLVASSQVISLEKEYSEQLKFNRLKSSKTMAKVFVIVIVIVIGLNNR